MRRPTLRTRLLLPALLIVFAVTACGGKKNRERPDPVPAEDTGPTAQELFVTGNESLDKEKWEAAIASYDDAVAKDPASWEAHMNRGIALSRLARFAEALSAFESALRNGGDEHAQVYFNLGNLYQDRGMYSASVDAYRAALAYAANDVDTLVNLGAAYIFLRQWESATATFEHTRQLAPDDPRPLHGLGVIKQLNDQYKDAAEIYDQVHAIDPNFALAYFNQARCYSMMEDYVSAIRAIERYMQIDPDSSVKQRAQGMLDRYKRKLEERK